MSDMADYLWLTSRAKRLARRPGAALDFKREGCGGHGVLGIQPNLVHLLARVLNEVYHPTIDRAQVRDMEFLVTDGETFFHEEKRDLESTFEYVDAEALGVRYINRDPRAATN